MSTPGENCTLIYALLGLAAFERLGGGASSPASTTGWQRRFARAYCGRTAVSRAQAHREALGARLIPTSVMTCGHCPTGETAVRPGVAASERADAADAHWVGGPAP